MKGQGHSDFKLFGLGVHCRLETDILLYQRNTGISLWVVLKEKIHSREVPVSIPTGKKTMFFLGVSRACEIFFPGIDDSHSDWIHSSPVHRFNNGYVGRQPMTWKEYCREYWLKEHQKSMARCTCRRNITEILLKTA